MGVAVIEAALPDALDTRAGSGALRGPGRWAGTWPGSLRGLDIEDNAKLLQLFRANRDTGLIPLIFFCAALLA